MRIKRLENGFSLPELGLGTWKIGGARESDHSRDAEWIQSLKEAVQMGYHHIDTASMYGVGHTEELVGQAIRGFPRESLNIATKVQMADLSYERLCASTTDSLSRLGLDYVDLLYIHAPNPEIPIAESMRAMDEMVARGLTKNIAVSNFTLAQLQEAQTLTKTKIVANQIEYNLVTREQSHYAHCTKMESEMLPYCQANDIFLVAYRPLDRGIILEPNALMDELSAKYGKTRAHIAINWLTSQKNVVAIVKSDNPAHLQENLGATDWQMDTADIERLRVEYPSDRIRA